MEHVSTDPCPVQCFLSYAHDAEGKRFAEFLSTLLTVAGLTVVWDRQITDDNPISKAEWIAKKIAESVVICVLSPDWVRRIGEDDSFAERKGVLYEWRLLQELLYNHISTYGCPVLLVAAPGFSVDLLPNLLKGLVISRVDVETNAGSEQLVQRLWSLGARSRPSPAPIRGPVVVPPPKSPERRTLRDIMDGLEAISPSSPDAIALVREWVVAAKASNDCVDFTSAFTAIARIIKSVGDVGLAVEVADLCLAALSGDKLLDSEKHVKSKVLILLKAWHLRRQGYLECALVAVEKGIVLADECGDWRVTALGNGSRARIYRGLAEVADADARDRHLAEAEEIAEKTVSVFRTMDCREEVGVYCTVLARVHFTRYELVGGRKSLRKAREYADRAGEYLPTERVRECFELQILRARIVAERGFPRRAEKLLDQVVDGLVRRGIDGASYTELLGRAYQARAGLCRALAGSDVMEDVEKALAVFRDLGLELPIAECLWLKAKVSQSGLSRRDGRILERLSADPRVRLAAVQERKQRIGRGIEVRWWARTVGWKTIVDVVR